MRPLSIPTGFICGTRAVVTRGTTYHVVCATCGNGGSTPYRAREHANEAAINQSNQPCRACGAR
jgi:hypothetical protein